MSSKTTREDFIKVMQGRPLGCSVKLPPNVVCLYRALTRGEINDHIRKHEHSILSGKRTKARYYEENIEK